jgi:DNA repair exonuclease SbcCD ATPase subunit
MAATMNPRQAAAALAQTKNEETQGHQDSDISYSSKLTNVESQRIMAVLQEIQKKVQLIGMLPDSSDKKISTVLTGDALTYIKEMSALELKYKTILETKPYDNQMQDLKDISKQIRLHTRSICRYFLGNSNAYMKLRYLKSAKSPAVAQFEHRLQEVKTLIYDRLRTTVEEENQKQDQLSLIIAKEQKTSAEVKAQREELEKAKKERNAEINKKNEVIRKLKDELKEIKQQAEEATRKLESRSKQKEDMDIKASEQKEAELKSEIERLKAQLEDVNNQHREEEALARKKKFKIESEVENWIHKYDQDLEEKQNEIDDITALFLEEKAHLDELQLQFVDLQKEYDQIQERQKVIEQKKKVSRVNDRSRKPLLHDLIQQPSRSKRYSEDILHESNLMEIRFY